MLGTIVAIVPFGVINAKSFIKVETIDGAISILNNDSVKNITYEKAGKKGGVDVSGNSNSYDFVDLGLDDGTLWATCNVGATKPYEIGDYFAWGETEPKSEYTADNYKWVERVDGTLKYTKYNNDRSLGTFDAKFTLYPEDNAAYVNMGENWTMPSAREWIALSNACEWTWMDNYQGSGISGVLGTSKYNNNTIFLPAGGEIDDTKNPDLCSAGYFMEPSLEYTQIPHAAQFSKTRELTRGANGRRFTGRNVRAILNTDAVKDSSFFMVVNYKNGENVYFDSKDVKEVSIIKEHNEEIDGVTVTVNFGKNAYVDLGLPSGLKWATSNLGASNPKEVGSYFSWGETCAKDTFMRDNYKFFKDTQKGTFYTKYTYPVPEGMEKWVSWYDEKGNFIGDSLCILEHIDDAAYMNWGSNWRIPTIEEMNELIENCEWSLCYNADSSEVIGFEGKSIINNNKIYLPVSGYGYQGGKEWKSLGVYTTSSLNKDSAHEFFAALIGQAYKQDSMGHLTYLDSMEYKKRIMSRNSGFPIRPVYIDK